jgi:hypothetical protein
MTRVQAPGRRTSSRSRKVTVVLPRDFWIFAKSRCGPGDSGHIDKYLCSLIVADINRNRDEYYAALAIHALKHSKREPANAEFWRKLNAEVNAEIHAAQKGRKPGKAREKARC